MIRVFGVSFLSVMNRRIRYTLNKNKIWHENKKQIIIKWKITNQRFIAFRFRLCAVRCLVAVCYLLLAEIRLAMNILE